MPEADLDLLVAAARRAGGIAREHFKGDRAATEKPDAQGPVTAADLAVNDALGEMLRAARPDYGWLSEESEDAPGRMAARRVFVVDPIDGTRAFIEGGKAWSHALAVVEGGAVTAAAVYLPMLDLLYTATRGGGARLNGAPVRASVRRELAGADMLTGRAQLDPVHWPGGVPDVRRHVRPSLAYRLCLVAEGRFDGVITFRDSWEWDIAAGDLIAREAGAVVTDRTGAGLRFNNPHPQVAGVIAAGAALHPALLGRLRPAR